MKIKKNNILGIVLTALLIITNAVFIHFLADSGFFTKKLLVFCGVCLFILDVVVFLLSRDSGKKALTAVGIVLACLMIIVQVAGCYYVIIGKSTIKKITTPQTEYTEAGIYVRKYDPAQNISDAKGYVFGKLDIHGGEATKKAIEIIENEFGEKIETKTYAAIEDLLDALISSREVNAIIIDKGFLVLLEESEAHVNDINLIREIYSGKVEIETTAPAEEEPPAPPEEEKNENVFIVYFSGIDCAGDISRRSRSDVNIIATVNMETRQILLLSTPRDSFVPLSISNGIPDKLTNGGIYGVEVSKATLGMLYDLDIDYYFRVNFDGFKAIVDALGGVTVKSHFDFTLGNFHYVEGDNFLNGEQALAFARERHTFARGDRQRGQHQMEVIKGVVAKITSPVILTNYKNILDSVAGSFNTSVPYELISSLIQKQLDDNSPWNIVTYSVDGTGDYDKPYSQSAEAYVLRLNEETVNHAKELIEQVKNGEIPTP